MASSGIESSSSEQDALDQASALHEAYAQQFASDPRVHYNTVTGTWQFEDDDGKEMEWDMAKGAWVPLIDEELVHSQQAAYSVEGVDENEEAAPLAAYNAKKKRKKGEEDFTSNSVVSGPSIVKRTKKGAKGGNAGANAGASSSGPPPPRPSKNTAVYISALPMDTTMKELYDTFSRFGVIEIDDDDNPKIKLYHNDEAGGFTRDALVVYFKEESVPLAITMLDDAELRLGDPTTRMRVKKADFAHKKTTIVDGGSKGEGEAGEKKHKPIDKKKVTKRIGKMQSKLTDWDEDDGFGPFANEPSAASTTNSRVVVLRHMFTLKDLEEDASLLLDLKEDVREECETLGIVTNVVLYDKEPDGVMTIKFKDPVSAQACILKMDGRFFDGRKISASLYTGKERFMKSGTGHDSYMGEGDDDDETAEKKRLEDFASWLENDQGDV